MIDTLSGTDCLIINLETSITTSDVPATKGINYRCHPKNVETLKLINVNIVTLANNHVLDWGEEGLLETLDTLEKEGILYAGAGSDLDTATKPVEFSNNIGGKDVDVKVLPIGFKSAGVPAKWKAEIDKPGVNYAADVNKTVAECILKQINRCIQDENKYNSNSNSNKLNGKSEFKVVSLHWGSNWGWGTPKEWRKFTHRLIDGGIDLVIGHSSHHVKGLEVYKDKLIAYGLGDFLNGMFQIYILIEN